MLFAVLVGLEILEKPIRTRFRLPLWVLSSGWGDGEAWLHGGVSSWKNIAGALCPGDRS